MKNKYVYWGAYTIYADTILDFQKDSEAFFENKQYFHIVNVNKTKMINI